NAEAADGGVDVGELERGALIYVGNKAVKAVNGGKLSDIAPTRLSLMGMEIPQEMTGKPLFIVD
ncbi:hypothetical protein Q6306_25980, partial [Klebsiella pneumoniae]|nr:hypothetical protein [Klebsiella pneumoniae]